MGSDGEADIKTSGISAFLLRLARRVWFRAALFTVAAVILALGAGFIGALIPFRLVIDLGQDAVGSIPEMIASSMLAVTTFSITATVTAYSSATTTATPRATAIEVIAALRRVLGIAMTIHSDETIEFPSVRVRAVELGDLLEDAIRPIARDGAAVLEIGIRLQKSLAALARLAPDDAPLLRRAPDAAADRALAALDEVDADRLRHARQES